MPCLGSVSQLERHLGHDIPVYSRAFWSTIRKRRRKFFSAVSAFFRSNPGCGDLPRSFLHEIKPGCFMLCTGNHHDMDIQFERDFASPVELGKVFEFRGNTALPFGQYSNTMKSYRHTPMRSCNVMIQFYENILVEPASGPGAISQDRTTQIPLQHFGSSVDQIQTGLHRRDNLDDCLSSSSQPRYSSLPEQSTSMLTTPSPSPIYRHVPTSPVDGDSGNSDDNMNYGYDDDCYDVFDCNDSYYGYDDYNANDCYDGYDDYEHDNSYMYYGYDDYDSKDCYDDYNDYDCVDRYYGYDSNCYDGYDFYDCDNSYNGNNDYNINDCYDGYNDYMYDCDESYYDSDDYDSNDDYMYEDYDCDDSFQGYDDYDSNDCYDGYAIYDYDVSYYRYDYDNYDINDSYNGCDINDSYDDYDIDNIYYGYDSKNSPDDSNDSWDDDFEDYLLCPSDCDRDDVSFESDDMYMYKMMHGYYLWVDND